MATLLESAIARIRAADGTVSGVGFLVGRHHVLTCAHVVTDALGLSRGALDAPQAQVPLDFPLARPGQWLPARITHWLARGPDGTGDLTLLELPLPLPDGVAPVRLVKADDLWNHRCRVYGFPAKREGGVSTSVVLRGRQATGWVEMVSDQEADYPVERGFSGGPVWDEQLAGVVGMVVSMETRRDVRAAFMIPADVLAQAWPQLAEQAISPSPYRGLFAFREEDAPIFFGREKFVDVLVEAVRRKTLVAVIVGPSGSGKSSVVFAGLIPRLREERMWIIAHFRPGSYPFHALAASLLPSLEPDMTEIDRIVEAGKLAKSLDEDGGLLSNVVSRILEKTVSTGGRRLLLIADQFEELYAHRSDPALRRRFVDMLLQAAEKERERHPPTFTIVLTLRADFMSQVLADRRFADALQDASLMLGPMTREELVRAIENPARKCGVAFEPGLVNQILTDVGDQAGALPLLEFALTALWERQVDARLTHTAYDAIGKVEGALTRYADEVYEGLKDTERALAEKAFVQMIRPGVGTEDTRRLATRSELGDETWALVQQLADQRLVVTGVNAATGEETVELIHEALIHGWGRLSRRMDTERTFRAWQERVRAARSLWEDKQHNDGALLHGALVSEAVDWLTARGSDLSQSERAFVQASVALRDAEHEAKLEAMRKLAQAEKQRADAAEGRARAVRLAWVVTALLALSFAIAAYTLGLYYGFDPIAYIFGPGQALEVNPPVPLRGGEIIFGAEAPDFETGEQLQQFLPVPEFSIQKTEVTNSQYGLCVRAGGCSNPVVPEYFEQEQFAQFPVVHITAYQASAYCAWIGGRLPDAIEWERAARGLKAENRPWPWGHASPSASRANMPDEFGNFIPDGPQPVGTASAGATPEGVLDLAGNVWEWTSTQSVQSDGAFGIADWDGVANTPLLTRGADWGYPLVRITEVVRSQPGVSSPSLGFRCAFSVEP